MDRAHHLGQPVITIAAVTAADANDLALLRHDLWPHGSVADHLADAMATLEKPEGWLSLIARTESGLPIGFAEASIRHYYVNGCKTSPVGFLEGIYVAPDHRRTGLARQLVSEVEAWTRRRGCNELPIPALPTSAARTCTPRSASPKPNASSFFAKSWANLPVAQCRQ